MPTPRRTAIGTAAVPGNNGRQSVPPPMSRRRSLVPMLRSRTCYCILCAVLTAALAALYLLASPRGAYATPLAGADATPLAGADPTPPAKPVSFINDVAPILKENCYACHDAKKHSGKLEMTSYAKLRQGGADDDPIVSGKPDDSLMIEL